MKKLRDFQIERLASEDWLQFRSLETLPAVAGVPVDQLAAIALKEATDNALDQVEQETRRPGGDHVQVDEHYGVYTITDDGPGIDPAEVPELFSMRRPRSTSRRWHLPFRGVLGNGLRVVVGVVFASGSGSGSGLVVETRGRRLTLAPQPDGSTQVIGDEPSAIDTGIRLHLRFGHRLAPDHDALRWAQAAVDRSRTGALYRGLPSPWWFDGDHFADLLSLIGDRSLREIVSGFDGCSGRQAGELVNALGLRGRTAGSIQPPEARRVLDAMRRTGEPVKPQRLGAIGRLDGWPGYVKAFGEIADGREHLAEIPFVVEVWARQVEADELRRVNLLVNRSPVASGDGLVFLHHIKRSWIAGCGIEGELVDVPGRGSYRIQIALTTPLMPILSTGKSPDLRDFADVIAEALAKAIRSARRAWRAAGHAQEDERAEDEDQSLIAGSRAVSKPLSQRAAVLRVLPDAIERKRATGYRFTHRSLFYIVRPMALKLLPGGLDVRHMYKGAFTDIVTEYENEHGPIPGMVRDPRGHMTLPHLGAVVPLGTEGVDNFKRPPWVFNKALVIEKEGIAQLLIDDGWHHRHDCAIIGGKGYSTRALRDLLDGFASSDEPLRVYCIHDADAAGTQIFHTLQEATRARGRRLIEIINLGLEPWEGIERGIEVETFPRGRNRRPVAAYVREHVGRASPGRSTWEDWLQTHRIELDAMETADLIAWLDAKMADQPGKLVPPDAVVRPQFVATLRAEIEKREASAVLPEVAEQIKALGQEIERLTRVRAAAVAGKVKEVLAGIELPKAKPLATAVRAALNKAPRTAWSSAVGTVAREVATTAAAPPRRRRKKPRRK